MLLNKSKKKDTNISRREPTDDVLVVAGAGAGAGAGARAVADAAACIRARRACCLGVGVKT